MGFTSTAEKIWPVTPDWSKGVQENLVWLTDFMLASATAVSQHRGLRIGPRRSFTFEVLSGSQERRVADMLLAGHSGIWLLPIWPDVQWLATPLAAGTSAIPCATAGYDFNDGGRALLYSSVNSWEQVEIGSVMADQVELTAPTMGAFGPGSRLFPLRRARVQDGAEERLHSDNVGRRSIAFDIAEPCDWPALENQSQYLTHPVLDARPDESDNPSASYARLTQTIDTETNLPLVHDLPGIGLRGQRHHWKLFGRAQRTWFRSLLYALEGRRVPIWVPTFASDLRPVAGIAGGSPFLSVEWAGYTLFGKGKSNRKDLRIELDDGTVLYRRIVDAVEAGDNETLTLDAALDAATIAPERIRQVSFMALSTLGSDEVEIDHVTDGDGVGRSTTSWQAVVPDV